MAHSSIEIEIRPESDIYGTYRRLSYKAWYAIAEFVDNSTQDFFSHRQELEEVSSGKPHLRVDVFYDNKAGKLSVIDNAYGMEADEITRALQLAKPPKVTTGRHEFGMGLKTAACWLGPRWSVVSTQLGSTREFHATIDVGRLREDKPKSMLVEVVEGVDPSTHYTRIEIEGLNEYERVFVGRTVGKIKEELASIYRRDTQSGDVRISWGPDVLEWVPPELLTETVDGKTVEWRKELDFRVRGKRVTGWIGILSKGKASEAGFHLFRRGRLITGGKHQGWKPWEIFQAPNSFMSQRLIGELDFDGWRASQAKDAIDWSGQDEHDLLETLKDLSSDYVEKAKESRRDDSDRRVTRASAEHVAEQTRDELRDNEDIGTVVTFVEETGVPDADPEETASTSAILNEVGNPIQVSFGGSAFPKLVVGISDDLTQDVPLVQVGFPQDREINLVVNLQHPFIWRFVKDNEEVLDTLIHLLYVDALVERVVRRNPDTSPAQARKLKDMFLRELDPR